MKKTIYLTAALLMLIIILVLIYSRSGKTFDNYDNKLKINNKTEDTLCIWFRPINSNRGLFDLICSKSYYPELIFPKKVNEYGIAGDWLNTIERMKGGSMFLLDYGTLMLYRNNRIKLDSNIITNVLRYDFPMQKGKLDSCDWIITYDLK